MFHVFLLVLLMMAFALLAFSSERHRPTILRKNHRGMVLPLRSCGWLVLSSSLAYAVGTAGWALGLVAYLGHASLAAGLVYCGLLIWERYTCTSFSIRKSTKARTREDK
ncbi:hypothetical protein D3C72_85370 [compost metagenome]